MKFHQIWSHFNRPPLVYDSCLPLRLACHLLLLLLLLLQQLRETKKLLFERSKYCLNFWWSWRSSRIGIGPPANLSQIKNSASAQKQEKTQTFVFYQKKLGKYLKRRLGRPSQNVSLLHLIPLIGLLVMLFYDLRYGLTIFLTRFGQRSKYYQRIKILSAHQNIISASKYYQTFQNAFKNTYSSNIWTRHFNKVYR